MKKVLFVATVVKKHINVFHLPYLKWFKDNGYETHVCARNDFENIESLEIPYCDKYYDFPFERSPFDKGNIKIYKQLKRIIKENNYDLIHCHTPIGGALTRLAARHFRNSGTKVIYTAHGFHFFKGAPIFNWFLYYPVERILARYTDALVLINKEDYNRAKKFSSEHVEYVRGIGIDLQKIRNLKIDRKLKRKEIGIEANTFFILSVGEINKNKNHEIIIRALAKMNNPNIKYAICGQGPMENHLRNLAEKLDVSERILFLGYRYDIVELCLAADLFAFPSYREGLSVSLMEAMAAGLPVVCSKIRGNCDLIEDGMGGYLFDPDDVNEAVTKIEQIMGNTTLQEKFKKYNLTKIKKFEQKYIVDIMGQIYNKVLNQTKL